MCMKFAKLLSTPPFKKSDLYNLLLHMAARTREALPLPVPYHISRPWRQKEDLAVAVPRHDRQRPLPAHTDSANICQSPLIFHLADGRQGQGEFMTLEGVIVEIMAIGAMKHEPSMSVEYPIREFDR